MSSVTLPAAVNFTTPAGILIHQIKGDRTGDFEWLVGKMKEALTKSDDEKVKQQAPGFKVYKNVDPLPQTGNVLYVILVSPTVAEADYNMGTLLNIVYKAFPEEQQEIYKRVQGAFGGGVTRWNLEPIADFANKLFAEDAYREAEKEAAAVIGFSSAIGAYGAFFIPKSYGTSIGLTGGPEAALIAFLLFYASCLALTWWYYVRRRAEVPC